jgi:hypothetical protein
MAGHGEKLGRKQEEVIAALLTQRNIREKRRFGQLLLKCTTAMTLRNLTRRIEYLEETTLPKKDPPIHRLIVKSAADDSVLSIIDSLQSNRAASGDGARSAAMSREGGSIDFSVRSATNRAHETGRREFEIAIENVGEAADRR